jgi:hypothetical protein
VHDRHVVDITSGSFEKETYGVNDPVVLPGKNAADLETDSAFYSAYRSQQNEIQHARNNWLCYDFKEMRILPTHYTIRTYSAGSRGSHLKSWVVETSAEGKQWREVAREEDNNQLNGSYFTGTFAVADGDKCRFIRLVNIGRNHYDRVGDSHLCITAWEIFGMLFE